MTRSAIGAVRVCGGLRTWASALQGDGARGEGGAEQGVWVVRGGRHEKRRYSIENRRTVYGLFRPYGEGAGGTALTGIGWR